MPAERNLVQVAHTAEEALNLLLLHQLEPV